MTKNDILYVNRIYKDRDSASEKGDIDYKSDRDLEDIIVKTRLFLNQITEWEEYKESKDFLFYWNKEPKCRIYKRHETPSIVIISIEELDKIMEEYSTRTGLIIKNN